MQVFYALLLRALLRINWVYSSLSHAISMMSTNTTPAGGGAHQVLHDSTIPSCFVYEWKQLLHARHFCSALALVLYALVLCSRLLSFPLLSHSLSFDIIRSCFCSRLVLLLCLLSFMLKRSLSFAVVSLARIPALALVPHSRSWSHTHLLAFVVALVFYALLACSCSRTSSLFLALVSSFLAVRVPALTLALVSHTTLSWSLALVLAPIIALVLSALAPSCSRFCSHFALLSCLQLFSLSLLLSFRCLLLLLSCIVALVSFALVPALALALVSRSHFAFSFLLSFCLHSFCIGERLLHFAVDGSHDVVI